jgi:hypothetical protein
MLAGGSEAVVIPSAIAGFIACKALSKRNDDPAAASRPWDQGRDGFVMGEGAGGWLMEGNPKPYKPLIPRKGGWMDLQQAVCASVKRCQGHVACMRCGEGAAAQRCSWLWCVVSGRHLSTIASPCKPQPPPCNLSFSSCESVH